MRRRRSEEERAAWRARMSAIYAAVKAMPNEQKAETIARYGIRTCEGHALSGNNPLLLVMQSPDLVPTVVGGFRQWQRVGRRVAKGQHALGYIMVPIGRAGGGHDDGDADGDADGEQADGGRLRFRWVPVWDITQTEARPAGARVQGWADAEAEAVSVG